MFPIMLDHSQSFPNVPDCTEHSQYIFCGIATFRINVRTFLQLQVSCQPIAGLSSKCVNQNQDETNRLKNIVFLLKSSKGQLRAVKEFIQIGIEYWNLLIEYILYKTKRQGNLLVHLYYLDNEKMYLVQ